MTSLENMTMDTDTLIHRDDEIINKDSENEYPFKYLVTPISTAVKDNFLTSPIKFGIALKGSVFADAIMNEPIINRGKGTVIISTKQAVSCNLECVVLGTWKVSCKLLTVQAMSYGVIGPIDESEDLVAIKEELVNSGYPVINIQRIYKRVKGKNQSTQCIKIGFNVKELPPKVMIWVIPFMVTRYMPPVRQCFKCQRFGHFAKYCNSKSRCLFCSEPHAFKECPKASKKCANCNAEHLANYGGCPNFQKAKKIERMSAEEGVSYSVIIERMKQNSFDNTIPQNNIIASSIISELPSTSSESLTTSYANVVNTSTNRSRSNCSHENSIQNEINAESTLNKLSKLSDSLQSLLDMLKALTQKILDSITPSSSLASPILDVVNSFCQVLSKKAPEHEKPTGISNEPKNPEATGLPNVNNDSNNFQTSGTKPKSTNQANKPANPATTKWTKIQLGGTKRKENDNAPENSKIPKLIKKQK